MDNLLLTQVGTTFESVFPTWLGIADDATPKENASELAAQEASCVANATLQRQTEYSTEPAACQYILTPTLQDLENEIQAAARVRIQTARKELDDLHARIEREQKARNMALQTAQEEIAQERRVLDGLTGERAEMERRARLFLAESALQLTLEKMDLAFQVRRLELEDTLAQAQADAQALETEIQTAAISDALELQLAAQFLEQLETAAPAIAETIRLAASAQENLTAALQAVQNGLLRDAQALLDKAKAGHADAAQLEKAEQAVAEARRGQMAHDLTQRMQAQTEQIGAVRRIKKLMDEAEAAGVTKQVTPTARRALQIARQAANARYLQARPIADHLADEGLVPVVGDGRIEVWKPMVNGSRHHGVSWTLDRVIVLRGQTWMNEQPRVPVTRKELPERVRHSRWFKPMTQDGSTKAN